MTRNENLEDKVNSEKIKFIELKNNPVKVKRDELQEYLDKYSKKTNKKIDLYEDEIFATEDGIVIRKVTEYVIGKDVLGRAFIYKSYIEILDKLNGQDYEVVEGHEIYHIDNPMHNEYKTRVETRTYNWRPSRDLSTV